MDNLVVKTVNFMDDELMALKDSDGIVWTGVNSFCRGIGLNKNERDRQVKNIQSDEVLSRGCVKFDAGVFDPNNETLALQLDYVPLWLAKISITPNMEENNPELVEKLVQYQLKAKDVLAAAFLPHSQDIERPAITSREVRITLYKNNDWGVLTIGDEAYNLTPDELALFRKLIPRLHDQNIPRIPEILRTHLALQKRSGNLTKLGSIVCEDGGELEELLPEKPEPKYNTRTGNGGVTIDRSIPLDEIEYLTEIQAKTRYSVGRKKLVEIASKAGAIVVVGNSKRTYSRRMLDEYFKSLLD